MDEFPARQRLLSEREAAALLSCCTKTLRQHVKDGSIRAVLIGLGLQRQRRVYDPVDIDLFIERKKQAASLRIPANRVKNFRTSGQGFLEIMRKRYGAER